MNQFLLFETSHHAVYLYEKGQLYLGRCVVALKSNKKTLSEMSSEEWLDLGEVVKKYEKGVKECFGSFWWR